jgi:hypothetical protein
MNQPAHFSEHARGRPEHDGMERHPTTANNRTAR